MNKSAIKKYAVWARNELIDRVKRRAALYEISDKGYGNADADSVLGRPMSDEEKQQRKALIARIDKNGYEFVIEEVAYTWFNRFAALRFMEVNGCLPSRVRVFTDEDNTFKPQILTEAINLDGILDGLDMQRVYELKNEGNKDALFKYLIIVQCNALSRILPGMFQKINDYTELLFPDNLLREGSAIQRMIEWIPEEDWTDQVQIIGWLYQYYNTEPKDKVFSRPSGQKITKQEIPAATQLFTPLWIVRYMVENSLGRLWLDHCKAESGLSDKKMNASYFEWTYYLEEAEQEPEVEKQLEAIRKEYASLKPEDIRVIDPCMGSGHILCYLFDVLVQIYESYGYSAREAVRLILEKNLYGLDLDERAQQLAYFAVMMKAWRYDHRFFSRNKDENGDPIVPQPHLGHFQDLSLKPEDFTDPALQSLVKAFENADEYGSLLEISEKDLDIEAAAIAVDAYTDNFLVGLDAREKLIRMVQLARILSQKYDVVVTNPPYMGNMPVRLTSFVRKYYQDEKYDLYSVFVKRAFYFTNSRGFISMITQQAWMFLSSFDRFRINLRDVSLINMVQLGAHAFEEISGEVVQTVTFTFRNKPIDNYMGTYKNLTQGESQDTKEKLFFSIPKITSGQKIFELIPGNIYAYWIPEHTIRLFSGLKLGDVSVIKSGIVTGNNNYFLRFWYEVIRSCINMDHLEFIDNSNIHWVPMHKGGGYRKHFGIHEYIMNLHDIWEPEKTNVSVRRGETNYYFKEGLTWSTLSNKLSVRQSPTGFVFDTKGSMCFPKRKEDLSYLEAFLNSKIASFYMGFLSPTLDFNQGAMAKIPFVQEPESKQHIEELSKNNVEISKTDWDSFETSWDFQRHPLLQYAYFSPQQVRQEQNSGYNPLNGLADAFRNWERVCEERFNQLKSNEEELNRIFIDIYGLQDELTPEVEDKDVTVRKADLQRDIKSLISYAVGCMFGRYSLDVDGLVLAGYSKIEHSQKTVEWDDPELEGFAKHNPDGSVSYKSYVTWVNQEKFKSFPIDVDNIIPITDDEYFENDIVTRFIKFIETVYGHDTLEENLRFIATALTANSQRLTAKSPREVIRNYFLNDFFNDHCKIYQKRPIYWLFDSGKKNGFKCLIYLHRYRPDTIARIRTDYVHEQQSRYRTAMAELEKRISTASTSERVKLTKQLDSIKGQADELRTYEEKIHHLADMMIPLDLDDGVKVNYAKFSDVLAKIK